MESGLDRALALVGDRWSFLVLRDVALGIDRFGQLLASTGAPRAVLTDRLHTLTERGLLVVAHYREPGRRSRPRYQLTEAGVACRAVLAALAAWGDEHVRHRGAPSLTDRHRACGGRVRPALVCECGAVVDEPYDLLTEVRTRGAA